MIPVKQGAVTHEIEDKTRVVDLLKQYGRMPVWRKTPARRSDADKAVDQQEQRNAQRRAEYAQRLYGIKPTLVQLWAAP